MNNSNNLLSQPNSRPSQWAIYGALIASLVGFADALYLTINHYRQAIPPCAIGSCETVLISRFATWQGIPMSLLGVVVYFIVGFLILLYLEGHQVKFLKLAAGLAAASFVVSLILVLLQLFVLDAVCLYCMVSAIASVLMFVCTTAFWKLFKNPAN